MLFYRKRRTPPTGGVGETAFPGILSGDYLHMRDMKMNHYAGRYCLGALFLLARLAVVEMTMLSSKCPPRTGSSSFPMNLK